MLIELAFVAGKCREKERETEIGERRENRRKTVDLGQKQNFVSQNARGAQRIGKIFILRSDRLENSVKMTAMARFIYNL